MAEELYNEARPLTNVRRAQHAEDETWRRRCTKSMSLRIILELALVAVLTSVVLLLANNDWLSNRTLRFSLESYLIPSNLRYPQELNEQSPNVVTRSQAGELLQHYQDVYYQLGNDSVDYFVHQRTSSNGIQPLQLSVRRLASHDKPDTTTTTYSLLPLAPNQTAVYDEPDFFDGLASLTLSFEIRHYQLLYRRLCKLWSVDFTLALYADSYGTTEAYRGSFDISDRICDTKGFQPSVVSILSLSAFAIACCSLLLNICPVVIACGGLLLRNGFRDGVAMGARRATGHVWILLTVVRDGCIIAHAVILTVRRAEGRDLVSKYERHLTLGIGTFLAWLGLLPHIKLIGSEFNGTLQTLQAIFPFVSKFVLGCMPLFVGYVLCGASLFSPFSPKFKNIDQSIVTLWAVLNGDWLYDNFQDAVQTYPLLSRFYFYTFMLFFICIISKLALSSVEYIFFKEMPEQVVPAGGSDSVNSGSIGSAAERAGHKRLLQVEDRGSVPSARGSLLKYVCAAEARIFEAFKDAVRALRQKHPRFEFITTLIPNHPPGPYRCCSNPRVCPLCVLHRGYDLVHSQFQRRVVGRLRAFCRNPDSVRNEGEIAWQSWRHSSAGQEGPGEGGGGSGRRRQVRFVDDAK